MPSVIDILTDPSFPADVRQQALDRVHADPGLPKTSTTSSFWIKPKHDFGQTFSEALPTETDTVIIGSGITGASIARTLLQNDKFRSKSSYPSVVLLEARTICSGATGRNGGHILETADEYAEIADDCGVDDARKIMKFRLAHLKEMLAVAEELGLTEEAQARKVQFLSAYFGDEKWKAALERLRRFKEDMPEESAGWTSYEGDAIPEVCEADSFSWAFVSQEVTSI
jgi:glycine/D-amino acid oxidase-like deaminating enzyme